ncbi:MAG: integrase [Paraglaciecola sp.]|jgi:integrase
MTNVRKPLNAATIKAMKIGDKDLSDTEENEGLRVSCANAGAKTFFYRYKSPITNKLCQIKIGRFSSISLAEARVKLQEYKAIRNDGRCPASEQKQAKKDKVLTEQKLSSRMTVADVVELYLSQYIEDRTVNGKFIAGARKKKGQDETRRTLYGDAVKTLGERYAEEITRKNIVEMVMAIVERGSNVQAGNVLRELTAAYEYAIGLEKFSDEFANPALLAKNSLRQAKVRLTSKKGIRVLSDRELAKLLNWLPSSAFTQTQKRILRFTLWTGCRTGEVCSAEWDDIDLNRAIWHLKATKTDVERYVQLSKQAIDFLRQLKLETGRYLFPSIKTGLPIQQKAITEQAWLMRRDERMVDIEHWVPHDLRRTVRTGLSRLDCPSEVGEAVLGHARSGIEGTYDLHKYEKRCKTWLQRWADHMDSLL